ncbi:MAG TPA: hypothetical protein VFH03_22680 [Actinoplanes sp.]|nr:hypothetical protein [Actinoplanes sp.]
MRIRTKPVKKSSYRRVAWPQSLFQPWQNSTMSVNPPARAWSIRWSRVRGPVHAPFSSYGITYHGTVWWSAVRSMRYGPTGS